MTEEEEEAIARERLNQTLDAFVEDVRDVIQRKVNDSISVDEVLESDLQCKDIVLAWVQRILLETVADDLDDKAVERFFDSAYFQIAAQHIGPEDFTKKAKPYNP